jgi:hypothetical protein
MFPFVLYIHEYVYIFYTPKNNGICKAPVPDHVVRDRGLPFSFVFWGIDYIRIFVYIPHERGTLLRGWSAGMSGGVARKEMVWRIGRSI